MISLTEAPRCLFNSSACSSICAGIAGFIAILQQGDTTRDQFFGGSDRGLRYRKRKMHRGWRKAEVGNHRSGTVAPTVPAARWAGETPIRQPCRMPATIFATSVVAKLLPALAFRFLPETVR